MGQKLAPKNGYSQKVAAFAAAEIDNSQDLLQMEDQERNERIWAERAVAIAKVEDTEEHQGEQVTMVLIRLGREILGLEVQYVFDIRPREVITRVPRVPDWVVGVTNLRGNILSVIDLRKYFDLPAEPADPQTERSGLLVFVQAQVGEQRSHHVTMEIVFLVDDVLSVETLPVRQNAEDNALIHSLRPEYIHSIVERKVSAGARTDNLLSQRHVILLDAPVLLSDPRLVIHEEVA